MFDFILKEDWFHSDLLKIFALNILKNSQSVEIHCIMPSRTKLWQIHRKFNISHDNNTSNMEFKGQLNIDTLDMAHSQRKVQSEKLITKSFGS